jgi:phage FluMu protein Com
MTSNLRCAKCDAPLIDTLKTVIEDNKDAEQVCPTCWVEINEQSYLEEHLDEQ